MMHLFSCPIYLLAVFLFLHAILQLPVRVGFLALSFARQRMALLLLWECKLFHLLRKVAGLVSFSGLFVDSIGSVPVDLVFGGCSF